MCSTYIYVLLYLTISRSNVRCTYNNIRDLVVVVGVVVVALVVECAFNIYHATRRPTTTMASEHTHTHTFL